MYCAERCSPKMKRTKRRRWSWEKQQQGWGAKEFAPTSLGPKGAGGGGGSFLTSGAHGGAQGGLGNGLPCPPTLPRAIFSPAQQKQQQQDEEEKQGKVGVRVDECRQVHE